MCLNHGVNVIRASFVEIQGAIVSINGDIAVIGANGVGVDGTSGGDGYSGGGDIRGAGGSNGSDGEDEWPESGGGGTGTGEDIRDFIFTSWRLTPGEGALLLADADNTDF